MHNAPLAARGNDILPRDPRPRSGPVRPHHQAAVRERRKLQVAQRFLRAAQRLGEWRPRRVLEIGCGHGILLSELHRQWPQIELVGVDRSPAMVSSAQARNAEALQRGRLCLIEADAFDLHPALGTFDAVVTVNFGPLGFPETRPGQLRRLVGLLGPGGVWMDFYDSPHPDSTGRHARHAPALLREAGLSANVLAQSGQWVETRGVRA